MAPAARPPIVAVVGRPNVGKSTLFNRYAGRRRALVADSPGITRDRIAEEIEVEDRTILLVDTAGLDPGRGAGLPGAIQDQARVAVAEADGILFVVDGKAGCLPEDEAIARQLHRTDKPVVLAVNKVDVPKHSDRVTDFLGLGFERTLATSAEHGVGAWDALEELVAALPEAPPEAGDDGEGEGIRVALVGRPNVGKSSLLNRLAGEERVVVSDVPGTTRDAIDTRVEHEGRIYTLVDTAGLRRQGRRDRTAERGSAMMTVRALQRADVALVVVDAEEGPTEQDARVASLTLERGCAAAILANKWDRVEGARAKEIEAGLRHRLHFAAGAPLLRVSAQSGQGLTGIWTLVDQVATAGELRIATSELNRWLEATVALHEPAMAQKGARRKPVKFLYATQTGVRPPSFAIFCTDPAAVQSSYLRFLENRLRESFALEGTPVRIRLRARRGDTG